MSKTLRTSRHRRLVELLTEVRKKAGVTQVVLAERVGRPQSYVAKYENGERRIDVVEFIELVEALGGEPKRVFARMFRVSSITM